MGTAREIAKGVIIGVVVDTILLGLPYLAQFLALNMFTGEYADGGKIFRKRK